MIKIWIYLESKMQKIIDLILFKKSNFNIFYSGHINDSMVWIPVFEFVPFASKRLHNFFNDNSGIWASVKSAPSILRTPSIESDK